MKTKNVRLLSFILLLAGCGDDMGSAPVLTEIRYRNSMAYEKGFTSEGFKEGEAIWSGLVVFEDPDGDLVMLHVSWQDCGAGPVNKIDYVQKNKQGITSGREARVAFSVKIRTDCPIGQYTVKVSASDAQGNLSNVLEAPYSIREPVEPSQ